MRAFKSFFFRDRSMGDYVGWRFPPK